MHLSKSILPYVLVLRPGICVGVFLLAVLSATLVNPSQLPFLKVLSGGLAVAFAAGAGSLVNDIYDVQADKLNNPHRVLPRGDLGTQRAWGYYFVLLVISLGLFWAAGLLAFLVGVAVTALLFIYSWKLRKINGVFSNSVIALIVASALAFGAPLTGQITAPLVLLFGFGFAITLAREILGDVIGRRGDALQGLRTLPIRFGDKNALWIASTILLVTAMFSYTPLVIGTAGNAIVGFASSTSLVFVLVLALREVRGGRIRHSMTILKWVLFMYPLGVVLGVKIFGV